jgi:hypothetical protein
MTTKATTRRSFTDDFKREAVSLLASSGRPLTHVWTARKGQGWLSKFSGRFESGHVSGLFVRQHDRGPR